MRRTILVAAATFPAFGQTRVELHTQTTDVDSRPIQTGMALPATCAVGDLFFQSNASSGMNLYGCATDLMTVCAKDATNAYAWRSIY